MSTASIYTRHVFAREMNAAPSYRHDLRRCLVCGVTVYESATVGPLTMTSMVARGVQWSGHLADLPACAGPR